ncbi:MAG: hypothetical protein WAU13_13125, partial [Albidovulum sp.]
AALARLVPGGVLCAGGPVRGTKPYGAASDFGLELGVPHGKCGSLVLQYPPDLPVRVSIILGMSTSTRVIWPIP